MNHFFKFTLTVTATVLLCSCASTTQINSAPPGADLFIDGQKVGKTPYSYTDTKITGSVTNIKLKKPGYENLDVILTRSEQADTGAIVGGVLSLVPFLWTMKYNPVHDYEMVSLPPEPKPVPAATFAPAPLSSMETIPTVHKKHHKKKK